MDRRSSSPRASRARRLLRIYLPHCEPLEERLPPGDVVLGGVLGRSLSEPARVSLPGERLASEIAVLGKQHVDAARENQAVSSAGVLSRADLPEVRHEVPRSTSWQVSGSWDDVSAAWSAWTTDPLAELVPFAANQRASGFALGDGALNQAETQGGAGDGGWLPPIPGTNAGDANGPATVLQPWDDTPPQAALADMATRVLLQGAVSSASTRPNLAKSEPSAFTPPTDSPSAGGPGSVTSGPGAQSEPADSMATVEWANSDQYIDYFNPAFVAEGRIGDTVSNGCNNRTFEVDVSRSTAGPFQPGETAQYCWTPFPDAYRFNLEYSPRTRW